MNLFLNYIFDISREDRDGCVSTGISTDSVMLTESQQVDLGGTCTNLENPSSTWVNNFENKISCFFYEMSDCKGKKRLFFHEKTYTFEFVAKSVQCNQCLVSWRMSEILFFNL